MLDTLKMEGRGRWRGWNGSVGEARGMIRCMFKLLLANLTVAVREEIISIIVYINV